MGAMEALRMTIEHGHDAGTDDRGHPTLAGNLGDRHDPGKATADATAPEEGPAAGIARVVNVASGAGMTLPASAPIAGAAVVRNAAGDELRPEVLAFLSKLARHRAERRGRKPNSGRFRSEAEFRAEQDDALRAFRADGLRAKNAQQLADKMGIGRTSLFKYWQRWPGTRPSGL